jgi:hypothetical protein
MRTPNQWYNKPSKNKWAGICKPKREDGALANTVKIEERPKMQRSRNFKAGDTKASKAAYEERERYKPVSYWKRPYVNPKRWGQCLQQRDYNPENIGVDTQEEDAPKHAYFKYENGKNNC